MKWTLGRCLLIQSVHQGQKLIINFKIIYLYLRYGCKLENKLNEKKKPVPNSVCEIQTLTIGSRQGRASVIVKLLITTGSKSRILGYMSMGDSVPEVITTV